MEARRAGAAAAAATEATAGQHSERKDILASHISSLLGPALSPKSVDISESMPPGGVRGQGWGGGGPGGEGHRAGELDERRWLAIGAAMRRIQVRPCDLPPVHTRMWMDMPSRSNAPSLAPTRYLPLARSLLSLGLSLPLPLIPGSSSTINRTSSSHLLPSSLSFSPALSLPPGYEITVEQTSARFRPPS